MTNPSQTNFLVYIVILTWLVSSNSNIDDKFKHHGFVQGRKASIRPRKATCFVEKTDFPTVKEAVDHILLNDRQRIQSKAKDIVELKPIGDLGSETELFQKLNIEDSGFDEINEEAMDNSEESSDDKEEDEDEVCYVRR